MTTLRQTLFDRVRTLLPQKLLAYALLGAVFAAPYYGNQYVSLRPVFPMPLTWLDRAIPFQPGTAWLYVSWYLMLRWRRCCWRPASSSAAAPPASSSWAWWGTSSSCWRRRAWPGRS